MSHIFEVGVRCIVPGEEGGVLAFLSPIELRTHWNNISLKKCREEAPPRDGRGSPAAYVKLRTGRNGRSRIILVLLGNTLRWVS